jgi:hypothetical protein
MAKLVFEEEMEKVIANVPCRLVRWIRDYLTEEKNKGNRGISQASVIREALEQYHLRIEAKREKNAAKKNGKKVLAEVES